MDVPSVLIVGVGASKRGDSSAGKWVIKRLMGKTASGVHLMEQVSSGDFLLEAWRGYHTVILAGAVAGGTKPGTLFRFEARHKPLPEIFFSKKSPAAAVFSAVETARSRDELPTRLLVYGIEGRKFKEGEKMGDSVKEATLKVAERILLDLRNLLAPAVR